MSPQFSQPDSGSGRHNALTGAGYSTAQISHAGAVPTPGIPDFRNLQSDVPALKDVPELARRIHLLDSAMSRPECSHIASVLCKLYSQLSFDDGLERGTGQQRFSSAQGFLPESRGFSFSSETVRGLARAHIIHGEDLLAKKFVAEALSVFAQGREFLENSFRPDCPVTLELRDIWRGIARASISLGDSDSLHDAVDALRAVCKLDGVLTHFPRAQLVIDLIHLSTVCELAGSCEESGSQFQRVEYMLAGAPAHVIQQVLAEMVESETVLRENGRNDRARQFFQVIERHFSQLQDPPREIEFRICEHRASNLHLNGKYPEAVAVLKKMIERESGFPSPDSDRISEISYQLANVLSESGDLLGAQKTREGILHRELKAATGQKAGRSEGRSTEYSELVGEGRRERILRAYSELLTDCYDREDFGRAKQLLDEIDRHKYWALPPGHEIARLKAQRGDYFLLSQHVGTADRAHRMRLAMEYYQEARDSLALSQHPWGDELVGMPSGPEAAKILLRLAYVSALQKVRDVSSYTKEAFEALGLTEFDEPAEPSREFVKALNIAARIAEEDGDEIRAETLYKRSIEMERVRLGIPSELEEETLDKRRAVTLVVPYLTLAIFYINSGQDYEAAPLLEQCQEILEASNRTCWRSYPMILEQLTKIEERREELWGDTFEIADVEPAGDALEAQRRPGAIPPTDSSFLKQ